MKHSRTGTGPDNAGDRSGLLRMFLLGLLCLCLPAKGYPGQALAPTASTAVDRARQAQLGQLSPGQIADWMGAGKISILGDPRGPFDFTLTVKGAGMVQRVIQTPGNEMRHGSDGKRGWQSSGPFVADAAGRVSWLIESLTVRSVDRLFDYAADGLQLSDLGSLGQDSVGQTAPCHVIQAQDAAQRRTRYCIDDTSTLVTRLEFDTDTFHTPMFSNKQVADVSAFVFSDYRDVGGVKMPFKIEVYQGLIKIEEMTFTSFAVNTGVVDAVFRP
jgi:hypothetical protein